ncbi:hypothetical protein SB6413_02219 [Klebsiella pasteurii]|uniref:hypothetical protein n=1 Tax=Klebsiella pasteurii TaxID=2587529 RepID=UPI00115F18BE|nr:hypothetical protein [Klebsiella pasteurii]VUT17247.1 hypothetical protein SB6413_02219 [Klebsiella pasteurii]
MSVIKLPEGKTPGEAAHELVLALLSSGHFTTKDKNAEEIYRMVEEAEAEYCRLYQRKLDLLSVRQDKITQEIWSDLAL